MGDRALINQSYGGRQSLLDGEAIQSAMGGAQGSGGTPTPTPAATFATQPSVSPSSGPSGTLFTATPGTVNNGTLSSRAWLLNGSSISTGLTATPVSDGTLTYQEFATGAGGNASSAVQTVAVAAAGGALAVSRPATFALADTWNSIGDSMTAGVGAPTNGDWPFQARALITSGPTAQPFHLLGTATQVNANYIGNGGIGGEPTPGFKTRTDYMVANYASEMNRPFIFEGSVNDYSNQAVGYSTTLGYGRNWPATVKGNIAGMVTQITGGKDWFHILPPSEGVFSAGLRQGASHVFHRRDMIATYGRRALDFQRHAVDSAQPSTAGSGTRETSGPDYFYSQVNGSIPLSLRSNGSNTNIPYNDAPPYLGNFSNVAPTDLNYAEGQFAYDTTNLKSWQKLGASGTGSWQVVDDKHFNSAGYTLMARMAADAMNASQGDGPPFAGPQEYLCRVDMADGATLGTVPFTGTATTAAITTDKAGATVSTRWQISTTGVITRKVGAPALTQGMHTVYVWLGNATGMLRSVLDVYVEKAAATAPARFATSGTGVSLYGRDSHGFPNGTQISGAALIRVDTLADAPAIAYFNSHGTSGAGTSTFYWSINAIGVVTFLSTTNAANQAVFASNANVTSATLTAGAWTWVLFNFDVTAGTGQVYLNDTAKTWAPTFNAGAINFADTTPAFLAKRPPGQFDNGNGVLKGGFGPILLFPGIVDWSVAATRRQLFDTGGLPAARTPFSAVGGVAPYFDTSSGLGGLLYGVSDSANPQSLVVPSWRARQLLSIAP